MTAPAPFTSRDVLSMIEVGLARSEAPPSALRLQLEQVKELQRSFRAEPVGGRLTLLKRLMHWFTASAFDRQAKAVEALLGFCDALLYEVELLPPTAANRTFAAAVERPASEESGPAGGVPDRLAEIPDVEARLLHPEKVLLYGLVFGLKPERCLEIGTYQGGSAEIICAALEDNGGGQLVCLDPEFQIPPERRSRLASQATLLRGTSPAALPEASRRAGGRFHFVLIDGDHSREGVVQDIEGVLNHLEPGAHLLFHDSHFHEVAAGIQDALGRHGDSLIDCGTLSSARQPAGDRGETGSSETFWGGLRLLRHRAL